MYCPSCKGTGLLQWPNFPAYERPGMGYSSPTRLDKLHNPLREGTPCPRCHGSGFLDDVESGDSTQESTPSVISSAPVHDNKERESMLIWCSQKLKEINEEINTMKETISSWTESKNKLKKQKKKLQKLEIYRFAVKARIKELKE